MLKRVRRDIRDSRNGGHCLLTVRGWLRWSKSDQMCGIRLTKLPYVAQQVGIVQRLRLKGCHVACDEWTSGEICSLQHMWVTGSVMWAAVNDESLKFGVKGATGTNWFPRVNGVRDNGIWLYTLFALLTFRGEIVVKQDYIKTFCPGIGTSIIKRWSDIILSLQWEFVTVKPVYKDHLIGYFSAFWILSRWPLAT